MSEVESLTAPALPRKLHPASNYENTAAVANSSNSSSNSGSNSNDTQGAGDSGNTIAGAVINPQTSMADQIKSKIQKVNNKAQMYLMRNAGISKRVGRSKMKDLTVDDLKRLEKVGRAIAKDKQAFDLEMQERRAVEAREVEVAENMGYIMPTEEEREKIELRNSEEVLQRVALQTLNKQFGKRLISQRHHLKALKEEHEHAVLDYKMLLNRADEDDRTWENENLDTHVVRWERHILLKTSQIAKAQLKLDTLKKRIDKDRGICCLHGEFVADGQKDISEAKLRVEKMTERVKDDYDDIQKIESEIKTLSAQLSIEVGHFKRGYRERKNAFEIQNRMHKNRTFEEILHEDLVEDKMTPAAKRMMLKAAAQSMKLKRSKMTIVNAQRRSQKLEAFFDKLLEATKAKDIETITNSIAESERRTLSVINQQQNLDIELSRAVKALQNARRTYASEIAAGSSAKMLARKRQADAKQIQLSKLERMTSKHTVGLERDEKIISNMSKHIHDILFLIWPKEDSRHYALEQRMHVNGGIMNGETLEIMLGEVDQWIVTMKRVLQNGAHTHISKKGRRRSAAILSGLNGDSARSSRGGILTDGSSAVKETNVIDGVTEEQRRESNVGLSYGPGGVPRRSNRKNKQVVKKFSVPVAPTIERFAGRDDDRPKHMLELKMQIEGIVAENGIESVSGPGVIKGSSGISDEEKAKSARRKSKVASSRRRNSTMSARRSSMQGLRRSSIL